MKPFVCLIGLVIPGVLLAGRRSEAIAVRSSFVQDESVERGRLVYQNNCLMCHSEELIQGQRLSEVQWVSEITKMVGWGAPVAKDEQPDLLAFLLGSFGAEVPRVIPARVSIEDVERKLRLTANRRVLDEEDAETRSRGSRLYATHCGSCHGANGQGGEVGTNLVEKPILLDEKSYRELVRAGRHKMPGFATVLKPSDEVDILNWLVTLPE